eukprot:GFKZ01002126.1.p1 GENE.GFKZ01002126.1~~GFKZ01002126.1.p1  ORF type:complete len:275 (-),score=36.11 GFKZ01002126.1:636-1370(-)
MPPPLARGHRAPPLQPSPRALAGCSSMQGRPRPPSDNQPSPSKKRPRVSMPASRATVSPSPRSIEETVNPFLPAVPLEKDILSVPRLSSMALASARVALARGTLKDLSAVADEYAYTLLSGQSIGPDVLKRLEMWNPMRVELFEALWAGLTKEKYGVDKLPPSCKWWREFYEEKVKEDAMKLEMAGERLRKRYSAGEEKAGRKIEMTGRIRMGDRRRRTNRSVAGGMSRIAKLRHEIRRDIRKR